MSLKSSEIMTTAKICWVSSTSLTGARLRAFCTYSHSNSEQLFEAGTVVDFGKGGSEKWSIFALLSVHAPGNLCPDATLWSITLHSTIPLSVAGNDWELARSQLLFATHTLCEHKQVLNSSALPSFQIQGTGKMISQFLLHPGLWICG